MPQRTPLRMGPSHAIPCSRPQRACVPPSILSLFRDGLVQPPRLLWPFCISHPVVSLSSSPPQCNHGRALFPTPEAATSGAWGMGGPREG